MRYYNITNPDITIDFRTAVIDCVAVDGSLYMPYSLTKLPRAIINNMPDMNLREIAYVISNVFIGDEIAPEALKGIIDYAFPTELPLEELSPRCFGLDLLHGSEAMGISFLSGVLQYFNRKDRRKINVLVSSKGHTAEAVVRAFGGVGDMEVFILCPKSEMTKVVLPAFTPAMNNIHLVEVGGNIDDCRKIVLEALADKQLKEQIAITSANSINIAGAIARVALFFYADARLKRLAIDPSIVDFELPSDNQGLITAGELADKLGLESASLLAGRDSSAAYLLQIKCKSREHNPLSTRFDSKTWTRVFIAPTLPALRKYILSCQ